MALTPGLPPLPENTPVEAACEIIKRLQAAGHEACLVGGCVRDWLLRLDPHDADVATSAKPEEVAALFEKTQLVGAHFGVLLVHFPFAVIEVATFRRDGEYLDFRRPTEVHFGTMEEDAARRDFTINALFYDPVKERLHDFFGGRLDLRRRILKAVGNARARFEEDALRLVRGVRFAAKYDLEIDPNTRKAMTARAANLAEISRERVGEELMRILTGPNPGRAFRLMSELGLWAHSIPEVEALHGCEQGKHHHPEGDVFEHTAGVLANLPEDPAPELALAALLHDIAKPATFERDATGSIHFYGHQTRGAEMAREIGRRLKYSNEVIDRAADMIDHHMMFMDVWKMKPSKLKRFVGQPNFDTFLALHRADSLGSHGRLDAYNYCVDQRTALAAEHGEQLLPTPLLTGKDLIDAGLKPGPKFKAILDEAHDLQLEGELATREAALEWLIHHKEHKESQAEEKSAN